MAGLAQRDTQPLTLIPMVRLEAPINLTPLTSYIWTVGGSQSEHPNFTWKDVGVKLKTFLLSGNGSNSHTTMLPRTRSNYCTYHVTQESDEFELEVNKNETHAPRM